MISLSSKGIKLHVLECKKVPDLAVVIGFSCPSSSWLALRKLKKEKQTTDKQYETGGECMAMCFSLFKKVQEKLCGDPTALKKFQVNCLDCSVQNGQFLIKFNVKGLATSLLRAVNAAISVMIPEKTKPYYKIACGYLRCGTSHFDTAVHHMNKSLADISVFAVGKAKFKEEVLKTGLDKVAAKKPALKGGKAGSLPSKKFNYPDVKYTELKCSKGVPAFVGADYLKSKSHLSADMIDNNIVIWGNKVKVNKDALKKWIAHKYTSKNKQEMAGIIAYYSIISDPLDIATLRDVAKGTTPDSIVSGLSCFN